MDDFRILPQLINELRKNGTMNAMLSAGVQPGNVIRIGDWEFDWEYEI
jgi:Obg family GTPase CgtA-like protein